MKYSIGNLQLIRVPSIGIIIQARLGSTRFPGKVLAPFAGDTVIGRIYKTCSEVYPTLVACPIEDRPLIQYCINKRISVYPGSESDVLSRYVQANMLMEWDYVIRVTGDCPLVQQETLYWMGEEASAGKYDFYSNCGDGRKAFDGNDVEVMSKRVLDYVDHAVVGHALEDKYREHVTLSMYATLPDQFKVGFYRGSGPDLSATKLSVDTSEDLKLCEAMIYSPAMGKDNER